MWPTSGCHSFCPAPLHPLGVIVCVCVFQVRKLILDMVLSTDMDVHFRLLARYADELKQQPDVRQWVSVDQRSLLFQMLVHLADLANPSRPWPLALKWAEGVVTEFLAQVGCLCCCSGLGLAREAVRRGRKEGALGQAFLLCSLLSDRVPCELTVCGGCCAHPNQPTVEPDLVPRSFADPSHLLLSFVCLTVVPTG